MKFRDLKVGEWFSFASEHEFPYSGMERGPWQKISSRGYQKPDNRFESGYMRSTVGSIGAEVVMASPENPVTIRSLGRGHYRVRTPGGVKAYDTDYRRAHAQRRILREVEVRRNPDQEENPPIYRLNWLRVGSKRLTPAFPLQIVPCEDSTIQLQFFGSNKYDVHCAFPGFQIGIYHRVNEVNYQILLQNGKASQYLVHPFMKAFVTLALDGLHADRVIMRAFKELDGFPKLPADWQYFQFVG